MEDEELYSDEYPVEFFYLWDSHADSFNIYRTIRPYFKEEHLGSASHLIPELAAERACKLGKILQDIPLIHSGYMSVMHPAEEQTKETKSYPETEETVLTF